MIGIPLNCTFIPQRNSNPNPCCKSCKQESAVGRELSCCSYCRHVRKTRVDCTYSRYALFVSDLTECIPIQINIKTSTPPFPAHLLSIVVYLATLACMAWTQCIFLINVTSDTEDCIADLMYYFTQFDLPLFISYLIFKTYLSSF